MADTRREFDVADILDGLPERLHDTMVRGVAETPDYPALIEDDRTWSYRQLADNVAQVAVSLLAMGIRPGDRMMVISENSIGLAALLLAASKINAWAIVVNPRLSSRELDQIRDHSGSRRMFFTAGVSAEAANHAQRVGAEIGRIGPLENIGISALNEATLPEPVEASAAKQVAVLIYTSGTTGTPKGVMLTHENLLFSAKTTALFRRMDNRDKLYVVLPISHIVRVPVENLIGEENKGWTYAKFLLGNERTSMAGIGRSMRYLGKLKKIVKTEIGEDDPAFSEFTKDIARVELDVLALEATELRVVAQMARGIDPGPAASLFKIRGTEIFQRITDLTHRAIGNYGLALREHPASPNIFMPGPADGHTAPEKYLNSRKLSIYGGSNEIQRNIIAKAVLGL